MPDPPSVGLINRYVFENPWPLALILLIAGAVIMWSALVKGHLKHLPGGVILGGLAIAIALLGVFIQTSGEHARLITRQFVKHVAAQDISSATLLLAPNASMAFDSPLNPGHDLSYIKAQLKRVEAALEINSNRITHLSGYVESQDRGVTHLTCWTDAGYGPTRSQWVIEVSRQVDGSWQISRLTCIKIGERAASSYQ
ncbi:MAG: hypothetical protein O7G85_13270 [Planctomycetota bacterium]|nr:hypothetical protein [Planctomycetota bacterium]